ncbi:MAG: DUF2958 domain-containing protein [Bradyrhizobium sp.]|nr:DUF2958 domain-containing protein [Bradyrhizobium sp.]
MKLLTQAQRRQLLKNGTRNRELADQDRDTIDFFPVVKLFCPWGDSTWLLTELDPEDPEIAFGLCDLGMGSPEIGRVSLVELTSVRGPGGLGIERDIYFEPVKTLSGYMQEVRRTGQLMA